MSRPALEDVTARASITAKFFSKWFDELEVGMRYRSQSHLITAEDVAGFADLTGDHHPQHVDPEYAARGPFGALAAHGMFVVSLALGLMPVDPARTLALRGVTGMTFKRPVLVGQSMRIDARVSSLLAAGNSIGIVTTHVKVIVPSAGLAGTDRVAARGSIESVWARDPTLFGTEQEDVWSQLLR
jgi:3-hydroxybutyryl-CoA dehydratase